ncbi:MAG: hypothetical protein PVI21_00290 [Candidatus Woesebacteria bacterium]
MKFREFPERVDVDEKDEPVLERRRYLEFSEREGGPFSEVIKIGFLSHPNSSTPKKEAPYIDSNKHRLCIVDESVKSVFGGDFYDPDFVTQTIKKIENKEPDVVHKT